MYRKEKPINIKGTTSSLCNNLSVFVMPDKRQLSYAVAHKSVVNITCASTDGTSVTGRQIICKEPSATQGLPFIMQAKWIALESRTVLVLTTQKGIQIFDSDCSTMIYWHSLGDSLDKSNFAKGITGYGDNQVCIGLEDGSILVFDIPVKGTNVALSTTIKAHPVAVSDLASEGNLLVSADELGSIKVWQGRGAKFAEIASIRGSGWPCNSVAIWKEVVLGGFASGHLRVYNAMTGTLGAEVTAHARAINAVDIASESGMALSVSDDTQLRIWQLKAMDIPQIEHRHSETVTDLQLVGGRFIEGQGRALCVTGYDSNEINFYIKA